MKIVYCIDSLKNSGGTERVTTTKVNWLAHCSGIEVTVVTLDETENPFFPLEEAVRLERLNVDNGDKRAYRKALALSLERIKPDVSVAVAGMSVDVLYRMTDGSRKIIEFHYTRNFLVNFVQGIRNLRFKQLHLLKMRWLQWKLARTARHYDCMVGLTKRDVELWGSPKNMTYVYNPLSFRSARKSTCESKRIIAVGSWTPAKGMDQLLEAFALIAHRYPDWHVDLYGSGQDEKLLNEMIADNHMEGQVTLHGPSSCMADRLVESSIYAFPSRSDGFGLVITEAMECGLPVVAMDCECGPREIVTENTGIIVPDKDITAFAHALERLMTDESLRKRMGKCASEEVKRFDPDRIMPRWIDIFNNTLPPPCSLPKHYIDYVNARSRLSYLKGLLGRVYLNTKNEMRKYYARRHGATIGEGTWISWNVAKMANANLVIGRDCAVEAKSIDLRGRVVIGDHVIINSEVEIIRVSHYIDDDHRFSYRFYPDLHIDNYSWIATGTKILPGVTYIARGTVSGAYCVLVRNTEEMGVYGGNPAKLLRRHNTLYDDFIVGSFHGTDLKSYRMARNKKK